jgi:hypothetical protein
MPVTLPKLVYGSISVRGNAGTRTQLSQWQPLYRRHRCLNRQRSLGVIDGTRTHLLEVHGLAPRLLRHRPQSAWKESHLHLSLIRRMHELSCYRRARRARARARKFAALKSRIRSSGCHTTRRPESPRRIRQSRLPANRTLRVGFGVQRRPRRQPKKCVREDSNLRHRRSHCRVPIRGTNTWSG